jgi:methylmalonyl-CoA/ethylmalonyl-CoA epimerase
MTMDQAQDLGSALESFELGPMDQVSYVVRNIDDALPLYRALFGPFGAVVSSGGLATTFRGHAATPTLKLAFGNCGGIEIELVEPVDGESPHAEHLARHGEGLQHVRFAVDDLDAKQAEMEAAGFVPVFTGAPSPTVKFAYLEHPGLSGYSMIELIQFDEPALGTEGTGPTSP